MSDLEPAASAGTLDRVESATPAARPAVPAWRRYVTGLGLTTAAGLVRLSMEGWLHGKAPYVSVLPAVVVAAWTGGIGPGLASTVLGAVFGLLIFSDDYPWSVYPTDNALGMAMYLVTALLIVGLADAQRRARAAAEEHALELSRQRDAVRQSEERLAVTLRSIGDAVIATDAEGRVTFLNPVAEQLTGWPLAEAMGRDSAQVFHILDETTHAEQDSPVRRVLAERRPVGLANHTILLDRGGACRFIDDSAAPISGADGGLVGVVLVFRDVSERRRAEEALRQGQEDWERTFNSVPDLIAILDAQHRIVRVNEAMARRLGQSPAACMGQRCFQCVHSADGPIPGCPHARTMADGLLHAAEIHEENLAGDFLVTTTPLRDPSGAMIGSVHVARDITEQKRVQDALRRSEEQLRVATLAAEIGVWSWAPGTSDVVVSANWRRLFGVPQEAPVTLETWSGSLHPDDRERAVQALNDAAQSGREFDVEYRVVRPDGSTRWIVDRGRSWYAADGRPAGMAGINVDITARKEAEEALRASEERYRSLYGEVALLNERLQRAMAETHHRVKNNLQVIAALVDIAVGVHAKAVPADQVRSLSQHVRGLAAIHDLLTEQAREGGGADHLSARAAMGKLLPILEATLIGRRIESNLVDLAIPTRQTTALALVVNELVANAVKHAPRGDIGVRLATGTDAGTACLVVEDEGPGFPPDFEPETAAHTGLDLVLMLSQWDLGGRAAFDNRPQGGARVTVTFPVAG